MKLRKEIKDIAEKLVDCPCCGEKLEMDIAHNRLECPFCNCWIEIHSKQNRLIENLYIAMMYVGILSFLIGFLILR